MGSAEFEEVVSGVDEFDDPIDQRFEPVQKGLAPGISDSHPDDGWWAAAEQEHVTEVFVFGDEDGAVFEGVVPEREVGSVAGPDICHMLGDVAMLGQHPRQRWRELRIDQEAHGLRGGEDRVVGLRRRVFEGCLYVLGSQIGVVLKNFRRRRSGGKERQHIRDAYARASNRGAPVHHVGVDDDSI